MPRFPFPLLVAPTTVLVLLLGCGGGPASTPAPAQQTAAVGPEAIKIPIGTAGIYEVNYGNFQGIYTFLEDGRFSGIHYVLNNLNGKTLLGHPYATLNATNSVEFPDDITWANFVSAEQGEFDSRAKFSRVFGSTVLKVEIGGSLVGHLRASTDHQLSYFYGSPKSLYLDAIPLAAMAGNYHGYVRTVGNATPKGELDDFTIEADGRFHANGSGCRFDGNLVQYRNKGVYTVRASVGGCQLQAALSGLVTPLSYDQGKLELAIALDSDDRAHSAVLIVEKSR